MQTPRIIFPVLAVALSLMASANSAVAADQLQPQQEMQLKTQSAAQADGSQSMTRRELASRYNARMRGSKTAAQRRALWLERQRKLQERAKETNQPPAATPPAQSSTTPASQEECGGTRLCGGGRSQFAFHMQLVPDA